MGGSLVGTGSGGPAPQVVQAHEGLMRAYRSTLREADLKNTWCQRLMVHIVVLSSRRAGLLLLTRIDGARSLATETTEYATALAGDDTAAKLLRKGLSLLLKPFSSWESAATTAGLASLIAYRLVVNQEGTGAWIEASLSFAFFALSLSWVAGRLITGRGVVLDSLAGNLDAAETEVYKLFGVDGKGKLACPPPRRALVTWGVPVGTTVLLIIVAVCEYLWIDRIVTHPPREMWVVVDVVVALVPIVVFVVAATLTKALTPLRLLAGAALTRLLSLMVRPAAAA